MIKRACQLGLDQRHANDRGPCPGGQYLFVLNAKSCSVYQQAAGAFAPKLSKVIVPQVGSE